MLPQDMALIVQDYDASSSTISHACEVRIHWREDLKKWCRTNAKDQKNTSWAKKQKLLFLHAIS